MILLLGCSPSKQYSNDYIIQNIGSDEINNARVEFDNGDSVRAGILISEAQATLHGMPAIVTRSVVVKYDYQNKEWAYHIDIGLDNFNELTTGGQVLYFQINPVENTVLFKTFSGDFPHDVLFSGKKLHEAIEAKIIN